MNAFNLFIENLDTEIFVTMKATLPKAICQQFDGEKEMNHFTLC